MIKYQYFFDYINILKMGLSLLIFATLIVLFFILIITSVKIKNIAIIEKDKQKEFDIYNGLIAGSAFVSLITAFVAFWNCQQ